MTVAIVSKIMSGKLPWLVYRRFMVSLQRSTIYVLKVLETVVSHLKYAFYPHSTSSIFSASHWPTFQRGLSFQRFKNEHSLLKEKKKTFAISTC